MSIREILKYPDKGLKVKASSVDMSGDMSNKEAGVEVRKLIEDMFETMHFAGGVGLAATQIGVPMRVIVLDIPPDYEDDDDRDGSNEGSEKDHERRVFSFINPELTELSGETVFEEGCLSLPGITADVKRAERLRLTALDKDGNMIDMEVDGFLAVALQHEIDHLDGKLFIHRLSRIKRELLLRKYKKLRVLEEEKNSDGPSDKAVI
ncbi:MAG: peptide deformylase [Deltaproteobacteria bacterium]|nr:peptide deformylase [Deltaproteobacteria bacterium]